MKQSKRDNKAFIYSCSGHFLLLAILIIANLHHAKNFLFGTAVKSAQQVQVVNAVLVLPKPSLSKVVTPTPPAPASTPTPPTPKPSPEVNPKPNTASSETQAAKPIPTTQADKSAEIKQKPKKPQAQKQTSSQKLEALQKLKSLGMASIDQTIDSNQKEAASAAQAAATLTLEEKYMGMIQQSIRSNWINQFDPNANLTAVLKINLDTIGNVLSVTVASSSGNSAFDRQAVLAVKKSSPLPLPQDPDLAKKFLNLTLPFNNQDLQ